MPRTKKAAGTTVDRRNGRRVELAVVPDDQPARPRMPNGLCAEAKRQWVVFWEASAAQAQIPADRGVALRWIDSVNRYLRMIAEADRQPLVEGSTGQLVENPLYKIADRALGTIERCEKQLGVGALNRAGLGIAVITEAKSLADMNAVYGGVDDDVDEASEEDPRLEVVEGEVV